MPRIANDKGEESRIVDVFLGLGFEGGYLGAQVVDLVLQIFLVIVVVVVVVIDGILHQGIVGVRLYVLLLLLLLLLLPSETIVTVAVNATSRYVSLFSVRPTIHIHIHIRIQIPSIIDTVQNRIQNTLHRCHRNDKKQDEGQRPEKMPTIR